MDNFGDALMSWAFHKTGIQSTAEDLVQETFMSAWKSFGTFKGQSQVKTWLFKILNNKIIDYYRKSSRQGERLLMEPYAEGVFDQNDNWNPNGMESLWEQEQHLLDDEGFNKVMTQCMDDLPTNWRIAMLMKYYMGKESKEVCQQLEITSSNYWQILHRAKLMLKQCLELKWFSLNNE
ncbi:MAG: sigma-70 family RNA polymerase sigma factor [Cyclobacteriaceae bacterium]